MDIPQEHDYEADIAMQLMIAQRFNAGALKDQMNPVPSGTEEAFCRPCQDSIGLRLRTQR